MEGPAFDGFAELEAEVRRLFRSARLWHQVEPWAVKSFGHRPVYFITD